MMGMLNGLLMGKLLTLVGLEVVVGFPPLTSWKKLHQFYCELGLIMTKRWHLCTMFKVVAHILQMKKSILACEAIISKFMQK
jgi:hypothetical protein